MACFVNELLRMFALVSLRLHQSHLDLAIITYSTNLTGTVTYVKGRFMIEVGSSKRYFWLHG
jgi:hypothetical protein